MCSNISAPVPKATMRSAASMARCGTFWASGWACRSISCWVARRARRFRSMAMRSPPTSTSWKTRFANIWQKGYQVVRVQLAVPEYSGYGVGGAKTSDRVQHFARRASVARRRCSIRKRYVTATIKMFDICAPRSALMSAFCMTFMNGPPQPIHPALQGSRTLPAFLYGRLPVAPDDVGWFKIFREETSAPLAMGELVRQPQ